MVIAYITDGHEAANFGIALGFIVLAYTVGVPSAIKRMDHPAGWQRRVAHLGLFLAGLLVIGGVGMGAVWLTRSDLIFRGDTPTTRAAVVAPGSGSSSSGSSNASSSGTSGDFCSTHTCVGNFGGETGSIVQCGDGTYSHAGGLSGACSHHGGEASGPVSAASPGTPAASPPPAGSATSVTPPAAVPAYHPPPAPPESQPRLTGVTSGSSGGFSFTVKRLVAQKDLDVPGNPPSFGVGVIASCAEPASSITTWDLSAGGASYDSGTATCLQGTINPEGMAVTMTVTGCGEHVLTVTPMGFGDRIDGILRPQSAPMRFPFRVCK